MTKEDKELLFKDLCARLPYGVQCQCIWEAPSDDDDAEEGEGIITGITDNETILVDEMECYIEDIKPYLRPMSSMTKEEFEEYGNIIEHISIGSLDFNIANPNAIDWLNAHHFDYRGLIEKGLAIEVTENNNPYKE